MLSVGLTGLILWLVAWALAIGVVLSVLRALLSVAKSQERIAAALQRIADRELRP